VQPDVNPKKEDRLNKNRTCVPLY